MLAKITGLKPGTFTHVMGDSHIYLNHIDQVKTQLSREPRPLPTLRIKGMQKEIEEFLFEDFEFLEYKPFARIKADMAV